MPKAKDIDAELKALAERAKTLKAKRVTQLGELVQLTGADKLDRDLLAGALVALAAETAPEVKEGWRRQGEAFFRGRERKSRQGDLATPNGAGTATGGDGPAAAAADGAQDTP